MNQQETEDGVCKGSQHQIGQIAGKPLTVTYNKQNSGNLDTTPSSDLKDNAHIAKKMPPTLTSLQHANMLAESGR